MPSADHLALELGISARTVRVLDLEGKLTALISTLTHGRFSMNIDTREEQVYPLPAIRRFLPPSTRTGKPVHPSVIFRWIKRGLKAADGTIVHLDAVKAGGSLCTSREAVERFFAEMTARSGLPVSSPVCSGRERKRITRDLKAAGLL